MSRPESRPYHAADCSDLCRRSEELIASQRALLAQLERNVERLVAL